MHLLSDFTVISDTEFLHKHGLTKLVNAEAPSAKSSFTTGEEDTSESDVTENEAAADNEKKALAQASALLARREYSAHELKKKILAKGRRLDEAEQVLQKLQKMGYQSDERFAHSFVRSKINKGQGPQRILQDLRTKGLDSSLIDRALEEHGEAFLQSIEEVWRKKFADLPSSPLEKQKQTNFLTYRGFTFEQIEYLWGQLELC